MKKSVFLRIIAFFNIIEWKKSDIILINKEKELKKWYDDNIKVMDSILDVVRYLRMEYVEKFLKNLEAKENRILSKIINT